MGHGNRVCLLSDGRLFIRRARAFNWRDNGGIGLLNINDGGVVNLSQIYTSSDIPGRSIQGGSLLTIGGTGLLTKTGNLKDEIQSIYVDTGKIVGAGGAGLVVSYDANADMTSVMIPEPSTLALLGLSGLALAFRRTRRKS